MRLGMIGLGKMGAGLTGRLLAEGHEVVAFDLDVLLAEAMGRREGATAAASLDELVQALAPPRIIWVMVPAGEATEATLRALVARCDPDDTLIDGGNSRYTDSRRRARELAARGIRLVDVGTSGGVWGEEAGYCLMVGGEEAAVRRCDPIFRALSGRRAGYAHVGDSGAGHFVKMIHNAVEYGLLQAYAEGFELLRVSPFELDLREIAGLWNQGSVVRSWLLELLERAYAQEGPELEGVRGWVADSGEGRWAVETALELEVPVPVVALSLLARYRSRQPESYSAQVISALRNQFGGHEVRE